MVSLKYDSDLALLPPLPLVELDSMLSSFFSSPSSKTVGEVEGAVDRAGEIPRGMRLGGGWGVKP